MVSSLIDPQYHDTQFWKFAQSAQAGDPNDFSVAMVPTFAEDFEVRSLDCNWGSISGSGSVWISVESQSRCWEEIPLERGLGPLSCVCYDQYAHFHFYDCYVQYAHFHGTEDGAIKYDGQNPGPAFLNNAEVIAAQLYVKTIEIVYIL